jgi:serine phosphatase RsbU (regulator of sigma subunit)
MRTLLKIIVFLLPLAVISRNVDSLKQVIAKVKNDSDRIELYVKHSYALLSDHSEALQLVYDMVSYSDSVKSARMKAYCYRKIGLFYGKLNYFDKALEFTFKSADMFEKLNDKPGLANCYNNIGNFYNSKGEFTNDRLYFDRAIDYHLKCIDLRKSIHDSLNVYNSYNNIGNVYNATGNYVKALEYYHLAYAAYLRQKDDNGIKMAMLNLGNAYLKAAVKEKRPDFFRTARSYYQKLYDQIKNNGPDERYAEALIKLGQIHCEMDDMQRGLDMLLQGYGMAAKIKDKSLMKDAAEQLAMVYEKKGDAKNTLDYMHIYNAFKDSLINEKNRSSIEQMQALYKSTQKDREIEKLNNERILQDEKLHRTRIITLATVGGLLLVLVLALVIFSRYNLKKKANEQLSQAYEKIELKNRQITDSINYARRIQSAILPPMDVLKENFRGFFIYYSPKDIVSGDFYWFTKKDGKKFFALGDCTGHGVPGALMSMIGNTLLNEIINQKGITDPGKILGELDSGISAALRQQSSDILTQDDGMDISICCVDDMQPGLLKYAAANHCLFIKEGSGVTELSGDIFSIGGSIGNKRKTFETKEYRTNENAFVIMSSDGYYDQFGSTDACKYLISNFEKLISETDFNSADPANAFKISLEKWKGNQKQTDDILVAGFALGERK